MFDSGIPGFGISIPFVVSFAVVSGLLLLWLVSFLVRLQRRGPVSGTASIIGGTATATEMFVDGAGKVWLEGEILAGPQHGAGDQSDKKVRVTSMDGLVLHVEPIASSAPSATEQPT